MLGKRVGELLIRGSLDYQTPSFDGVWFGEGDKIFKKIFFPKIKKKNFFRLKRRFMLGKRVGELLIRGSLDYQKPRFEGVWVQDGEKIFKKFFGKFWGRFSDRPLPENLPQNFPKIFFPKIFLKIFFRLKRGFMLGKRVGELLIRG